MNLHIKKVLMFNFLIKLTDLIHIASIFIKKILKYKIHYTNN
jgi:hypothetical protein